MNIKTIDVAKDQLKKVNAYYLKTVLEKLTPKTESIKFNMKTFNEWLKIRETVDDDLGLDLSIDTNMDLEPVKTNLVQPRTPTDKPQSQPQPAKKPSGTIQLGKGTNFSFLEGISEDELIRGTARSSGFRNLGLVFQTKDPSFKQFLGTKNLPVTVVLSSIDNIPIKKGYFGSVNKFGELPAKMDVLNKPGIYTNAKPQEGYCVTIKDIKINITDKDLSQRFYLIRKLTEGNGRTITSRSFQDQTITVKM